MATQPKVFISYAQETKDRAIELSKALDSIGVYAWLDVNQLQPGQSWKAEIEKAAEEADSFVILVGPKNTSTSLLESEWQAALSGAWDNTEKLMLPVVFGAGDPPSFLRHWVSLKVDPDQPANQWTHPIVEALLQRLSTPTGTVSIATRGNQEGWRERVTEIASTARKATERLGTDATPKG